MAPLLAGKGGHSLLALNLGCEDPYLFLLRSGRFWFLACYANFGIEESSSEAIPGPRQSNPDYCSVVDEPEDSLELCKHYPAKWIYKLAVVHE